MCSENEHTFIESKNTHSGQSLAGGVVSEDRGVAAAGGEDPVDGGKRCDASASADGGAIECGGGAGEIELPLQGPPFQKRVDEAGMKKITGACRVNGVDMKRRRVVEQRAVPSQHAVGA